MPQRTCDIDGCERTHSARGLCAMHWKRAHGRRTRYSITCETCGTQWESSRPDGRFCSDECKGKHYTIANRTRSRELVHVPNPDPVTWLPKQHPVIRGLARPKQHTWYCGKCAWCGAGFVDWQPAARHCSPQCTRRAGRSRGKGFSITLTVRLAIYERDEWICQLCCEPVDRDLMTMDPGSDWAPSLDHIVCQAWVTVPDHSASNLRLAHRWCNAVRGDGRYYNEADLRAS